MCLFLQNQNFQQHTEHLINSLYGTAQYASDQLHGINSSLTLQASHLHSMQSVLGVVSEDQQRLAEAAAANLAGVQKLQTQTADMDLKVQTALENEVSPTSFNVCIGATCVVHTAPITKSAPTNGCDSH